MRIRRTMAPTALGLLLAACAGGDGPGKDRDTSNGANTDSTPVDPCVLALDATLGTGPFTYTQTTSGDTVQIVHGEQGGWHLDFAASLVGVGRTVDVLPAVTLTDGTQIAGEQLVTTIDLAGQQGTYKPDQCAGTFYGERAYLDDYLPQTGAYYEFSCSLEGQAADVSIEVTDVATGQSIVAISEWVLQIDPADQDLCAL